MSETPIFDDLMSEFFPESIEVGAGAWRLFEALALRQGLNPELLAQDVATDYARRVLREVHA